MTYWYVYLAFCMFLAFLFVQASVERKASVFMDLLSMLCLTVILMVVIPLSPLSMLVSKHLGSKE